jgi:GT2 family glycosyltransferase
MADVQVTAPPTGQPIDVLVPCKNNLYLTIQCIDHLYNFTRSPFHLIVVDSSTDETMLYLRRVQKEHQNVTVIHQDVISGNHFFNLALAHCKTPYMATVMNSVQVAPDWDTISIQLMNNDPKVGVIGLKCVFPWGNIESAGIQMSGYTPVDIGKDMPGYWLNQVSEVPACQWAFALLRVEAAKGVLVDDLYNAHKGWDDIDNCFVLKKNGWKILYNGFGVGVHYPRSTRGDNGEDARVQNLQNAQIFYKRWGYWKDFKEANPNAVDLIEEKDGIIVKKDLTNFVAQVRTDNMQTDVKALRTP